MQRAVRFLEWMVVAIAIAGCGAVARTDVRDAAEAVVRRPLPAELGARRAIAYSGYRAGQSPDAGVFPSPEQIAQDLDLLIRGGWGAIRLFDAGEHAARVLQVIRDRHLDLEVIQGVWIAGPAADHDLANQAEIARALALVARYPDRIVALSVGNETLDDWSDVRVAPAELAAYIGQVRAKVTVPVTTDDSWLPFLLGGDGTASYADVLEVARAIDFLSLHVYAFSDAFYDGWDWKQAAVPDAQRARAMMDAAIAYTKLSVREVRATMAAHGLDLPIVLGEIGWKSTTPYTLADSPEHRIEVYLAHPVNQKMFQDAVTAWVYGADRDGDSPIAAFTFEAFDEPWKGAWGDDGWGLFDTARVPRFAVWGLYPDLVPAGAPAYADSDAVHYRP